MKIYVLEYDLEILKFNSFSTEVEHRIEMFTDISEFINSTKNNINKYYVKNIKTHIGETKEIDFNKVINPF